MRTAVLITVSLTATLIGAAVYARGQLQSAVPYGDIGPTFYVSESKYVYPTVYASMRSIDFGNFDIHIGGDPKGVSLKNGKHIENDALTHDEVGLNETYYLTSGQSTGAEYILLSLYEDSGGGSSSQEAIYQVLELSHEKLRLVQEMSADLHYGGPYFPHPFDEKTKTLVLHSAHYRPGDAHCCVSAMDVITLKWNGSRFVQSSIETELTNSGKEKGKKLRP